MTTHATRFPPYVVVPLETTIGLPIQLAGLGPKPPIRALSRPWLSWMRRPSSREHLMDDSDETN